MASIIMLDMSVLKYSPMALCVAYMRWRVHFNFLHCGTHAQRMEVASLPR